MSGGRNPVLKLWQLLSAEQRRQALVLLTLMIVGMALETLGVGAVLPVLAILTRQDIASTYPIVASIASAVGNPSREELVIGTMVLLVMLFTVKAGFIAFMSWKLMQFVFGVQADMSQRLFAGYLRQTYAFHLNRNSAQLIRNTIGEVSALTNVTQPGLIAVAETLVVLGVAILLVSAEPVGTLLVAGILGSASWAFHRVTRGRILHWGRARQLYEGFRIQYLQEALGGVKEVKLLGREEEFFARYRAPNQGAATVLSHQYTIQALPRLWLELLAVLGMALLVVSIVERNRPLEMVLPTAALFGIAAFRILPSANRIINSIQSVRYALPVVDLLDAELGLMAAVPAQRTGATLALRDAIRMERVCFAYPGATRPALQEISLTIPRGRSVGIIGATGAGKTTLVDVMLGLLEPTTGAVRVDGVDIRTNIRGWQNCIGYVAQSIFLTDDSLRRNIAFGVPDGQVDEEALRNAVSAAQLESWIGTLPDGLATLVGERGVRLSGGQRQRIGIARALYHRPAVLVLDEASSALDLDTERQLMREVRALRGDKTIVIVTHRLTTVEHCDRIFRLEDGVLVRDGSAAAVLPNAAASA